VDGTAAGFPYAGTFTSGRSGEERVARLSTEWMTPRGRGEFYDAGDTISSVQEDTWAPIARATA